MEFERESLCFDSLGVGGLRAYLLDMSYVQAPFTCEGVMVDRAFSVGVAKLRA